MRVKATVTSDTGRVWMIVRRPKTWPQHKDGIDNLRFPHGTVRLDWDDAIPGGDADITLLPHPHIYKE